MANSRARTSAARQAAGVDLDARAFAASLRREVTRMKLEGKRDVEAVALQVQNEARKLAPVDTGRLRSSIIYTMGEDARGPYAEIGTNVEYAGYVEFGTLRSAPQPYMRPALLLALRWWRERRRKR